MDPGTMDPGTMDPPDPPDPPEMCPEGQVGTPPECVTPEPMRPEADAKQVETHAMAIMALEPDPAAEPAKAFGAGVAPFDGPSEGDGRFEVAVEDDAVTVTDIVTNASTDDDTKLTRTGGAPHGDQGDWAGSLFERENTDDDDMVTSTEQVVVYTNYGESTQIPFAKTDGRYERQVYAKPQ